MKKRYMILIAALLVCAVVCLFLLQDGFCIGRIENRTDDQWSQLHVYMNEDLTVDFPIQGENRSCLFQYETGRGCFFVKITDAEGNVVYSDFSTKSGSAAFEASSDLTLWIKGLGHGGTFSLLQREESFQDPNGGTTNGFEMDGDHTGEPFTATYELRKVDGKYLNFYVRNDGTDPVVLTINGEYDRTIAPGESGHIRAPLSASILPQTMTATCSSATGGEIDIYWKLAQRNP